MKTPTITHYSRDVSVRLLHVSMCKSLEGQGLICYTALMAGKKILHKKNMRKRALPCFTHDPMSNSALNLSPILIVRSWTSGMPEWVMLQHHLTAKSLYRFQSQITLKQTKIKVCSKGGDFWLTHGLAGNVLSSHSCWQDVNHVWLPSPPTSNDPNFQVWW